MDVELTRVIQRTNPTDIPASSFAPQLNSSKANAQSQDALTLGLNLPGASLPTTANAAAAAAAASAARKKQTPNVRKVLLGRKNLKDWLEELVCVPASSPFPNFIHCELAMFIVVGGRVRQSTKLTQTSQTAAHASSPPYVRAAAPPPATPARKICSSCGYLGAYRCQRCAEWSCSRECLEVHERDGGCGIGG